MQDHHIQFHMTLSFKACSSSRRASQSTRNEDDQAQGRQNSGHEEITFDFFRKCLKLQNTLKYLPYFFPC